MPIVDLQRRLREIGRLRIGEQVATSGGKSRPRKLDKFRFTSRDKAVIEATAVIWGGEARTWDAPDGEQWENISDTAIVDVVVPPGDMSFSQWYEQWSAGGCQRRCDGRWDSVRDQACDCNPESRECKVTTRLSVMLPDVPGLGVWRLETHGYYGAVELAGAVDICRAMTERGQMVPARLRIETRKVIRPDKDGKPATLRFAVPVLDIDVTLQSLGGHTVALDAPLSPQVPPPQPGWQPVGELPPAPLVSVRDQLDEVQRDKPSSVKKRANAAAPIKATGIKPKPAAEHRDEPGVSGPPSSVSEITAAGCEICGLPYGTEPLVKNPVPGGTKFVHSACLTIADGDTDPIASPARQPSKGGRDGTAGVKRTPPAAQDADPVPAVLRVVDRKPTPKQRSMLFALAAEVFDVSEELEPAAQDKVRQALMFDLAADLGSPGLTSRREIDHDLASKMIDAFGAIKDGRAAWIDGTLVSVDGDGVIGNADAIGEAP